MKPIEYRIKEYIEYAEKTKRFADAGFYNDILTELASRQARIDMLMDEYCPDEMTPEQIEEWSKRQVRVKLEIGDL